HGPAGVGQEVGGHEAVGPRPHDDGVGVGGHRASLPEGTDRTNRPIPSRAVAHGRRRWPMVGRRVSAARRRGSSPVTDRRCEEGDVGHGDDGIVLSEREREALAGLAESIGDPWLAGQLAGRGQGHAPPRPAAPRPPTWARLVASGWAGLVLLVVGALLAMTTFVHSTIAAT